MQTNVYVDGFNLYYGCLEETPYRWLDLVRLCQLLPRNRINRIRYFTALVEARPEDPDKPRRQLTYLRALNTIPSLSIHYGSYATRAVRLPLVNPPLQGSRFVEVWRTDEKGSDVNLATYLLADAFEKDYEVAVLISNDSDLKEPIKMVRSMFGLRVGILLPILRPGRRASQDLLGVATFVKTIRESALRESLFPTILTDKHGTITKPESW